MTLAELRARVASLMDYDPTSEAYVAQVDKALNEANDEVCTARVWPFMLSEDTIKVDADVELTLGVVNGSATFTTGAGLYEEMWGRRVVVNGVEMQIAHIGNSGTGYFTRDYPGITGSYVCQIQHHIIRVPQKASALVDLAVRDPEENSGRVPGLLRRDDVSMDNDPWMEGTAQVWVPLASQRTAPPRVGGTPTTRAVGAGQGDRTVDICVTHTFAGVESEPGKVSTLTMGDAQDLRIALPALSNQTGLYRRIYWRAPEHGVYAWRRCTFLYLGVTVDQYPPAGATNVDIDLDLAYIESEAVFAGPRLARVGGSSAAFRLWPRPSADVSLTATLLNKPEILAEDVDTTRIPEASQDLVAFLAVSKLYLKHGNVAMSRMFADKAEAEMKRLEGRSLTQTQRRIVKGSNWGQGTRFSPAVDGTITFVP